MCLIKDVMEPFFTCFPYLSLLFFPFSRRVKRGHLPSIISEQWRAGAVSGINCSRSANVDPHDLARAGYWDAKAVVGDVEFVPVWIEGHGCWEVQARSNRGQCAIGIDAH